MLDKKMFCCAFFAVAVLLYADNDVDLNLNGDFRGAAVNASAVPHWSTPKNGTVRVVATDDPEDFALELKGTATVPAESMTDFCPVSGNMLEFDAEATGSGKAVITVYFFDGSKKIISSRSFEQNVSAVTSKFEQTVPLVEKTSFVQLGIAAAAKSTVTFADIDAEFKTVAVPRTATASAAGKQDVAMETANIIPPVDGKKLKGNDIKNGAVYSDAVSVGKDVDLNLNGDFRGAEVNASAVPGWSIPKNGTARVVATDEPEDFALELKGTATVPAESMTDFYPVSGNMIEFDAEATGNGKAVITVYFFDGSKKLISSRSFERNVSTVISKFEQNVPLVEKTAFAQLGISAAAKSTVTFSDVDAEFKTVAVSRTATASAAGKQDVAMGTANMISLVDDQKLKWDDIRNGTVYSIIVGVGKDVDIELGQQGSTVQWKILTADSKLVYTKIEHDTDDTLGYKTELEIKGLASGTTAIVLSCGDKTITISCDIR